MNEIYQTTKLLIDRFKDNLINTVTYAKSSEIDQNKENIYPLVNIDIIDADLVEGMNYINYKITVVAQRDYENDENIDKGVDGSNMIDNLGETHRVLQIVINSIKNNHNPFDIDIINIGKIFFLKDFGTQRLDGVQISFSLVIENGLVCHIENRLVC